MLNFEEYELVFRASIAVPRDDKPELDQILQGLTKRLEILGQEKFLVGVCNIYTIKQDGNG